MNQYTRRGIYKNSMLVLIFAAATLSLVKISLVFQQANSENLYWILLACASSFIILERNAFIDAVKFISGDEGERRVANKLKDLPKPYRVIPDITILNSERKKKQIDFVVIGPRGVTLLEVKNYAGSLYVEDQRIKRRRWIIKEDCISQVNSEETALRNLLKKLYPHSLPPKIYSYIVFSNPNVTLKFEKDVLPRTRAIALKLKSLNPEIKSQKGGLLLTTSGINQLAKQLENYATDRSSLFPK